MRAASSSDSNYGLHVRVRARMVVVCIACNSLWQCDCGVQNFIYV